jgi:hypothetical protein
MSLESKKDKKKYKETKMNISIPNGGTSPILSSSSLHLYKKNLSEDIVKAEQK